MFSSTSNNIVDVVWPNKMADRTAHGDVTTEMVQPEEKEGLQTLIWLGEDKTLAQNNPGDGNTG